MSQAVSQDTIVMTNGKTINCKILKIENGLVYYVKNGNKKERFIDLNRIKRHTYQPATNEKTPDEKINEYQINEDLKLPYIGEKVTFTKSFKIKNLPVTDIYARLLGYAGEKEQGITKTIKYKNQEQGKVTLRCMVPSFYETFFKTENSRVFFNMMLSVVDNEINIILTDFYIESPDANTTIEVWDSHSGEFFRSQLDNIYKQMNQLLNDIENKIRNFN